METIKIGEEELPVFEPKWGEKVDSIFEGAIGLAEVIKGDFVIVFNDDPVRIRDDDTVEKLRKRCGL